MWGHNVFLHHLFCLGGYYHGKLIFPREFPFKPPSIYMITPNGRFKCNTRWEWSVSFLRWMIIQDLKSFRTTKLLYCNCACFLHRLCLSITDFHPDTWNPAWSVSTILTGLLSFMVEKGPTLGSIETSDYTVRPNKRPWMQNKVTNDLWRLRCLMLILFIFQKRQLSAQSLAFNLKDKVFCELFPDVVDVRMS